MAKRGLSESIYTKNFKKIFDKDGKLKFFKATDWNKKNISFIEEDKDDDLPF